MDGSARLVDVPTLTMTRGLPGSGKTGWAVEQVRARPGDVVRVADAELRRMLVDGHWVPWAVEHRLVLARDAYVGALLHQGFDVIVDDVNLSPRVGRRLAELAGRRSAEFAVQDFTDVPLAHCIAADAANPDGVGEAVITRLWEENLSGQDLPLPVPHGRPDAAGRPYTAVGGTPSAVLVDIDGTVALLGTRSPYAEDQVDRDAPNPSVITTVRALAAGGNRIVYCSGRSEDSRPATTAWLDRHVGVPYETLLLRPSGDRRRDAVVKLELFDDFVRPVYDVLCVLEDRASVVQAWRSIGLTVLQVADGDF